MFLRASSTIYSRNLTRRIKLESIYEISYQNRFEKAKFMISDCYFVYPFHFRCTAYISYVHLNMSVEDKRTANLYLFYISIPYITGNFFESKIIFTYSDIE